MKSFRVSLDLIKMAWAVIREDKRIITTQFISLVAILGVLAGFGYILHLLGFWSNLANDDGTNDITLFTTPVIITLVVGYITCMLVTYITEAFIANFTLANLRNIKVGLGSILKNIRQKFFGIFQFTLLSSSIGMVLRVLEERLSWFETLSASLLNGAWNLASAFAVVQLVDDKATNGIDATKKSAQTLIRAFGPNITLKVGVGIIAGWIVAIWITIFVIALPILASVYYSEGVIFTSTFAFGVIGLFVIMLIISTMQSVLSSMLYEYVQNNNETAKMDKELFKSMITEKKATKVFSHQ